MNRAELVELQDAYQKLRSHHLRHGGQSKQNALSNEDFEKFKEKIKQSPQFACSYARYIIRQRWPEAEEYIKKDPEHAVTYAKEVIKKKWKEAEEYIKKDPKELISYTIHVLKRRWEKEEHIMLTASPNQLFVYFTWLYKKSEFDWPEAEKRFQQNTAVFLNYLNLRKKTSAVFEQQILNDPENKSNPRYIYEYCSKLLKSRWKEAEHIIFKNSEYSVKYCTKFEIALPEDIHNKIIAEVAFTNASVSKKIYLSKLSKTKRTVQKYIQELISKNIITIDSPVGELLK